MRRVRHDVGGAEGPAGVVVEVEHLLLVAVPGLDGGDVLRRPIQGDLVATHQHRDGGERPLDGADQLIAGAIQRWGRLDALVNNASTFYPSPLGSVSESVWEDLVDVNLKAPFFLAQAAFDALARSRGAIVNIVDIYIRTHKLCAKLDVI